ncbi:MAG: proteobacterial dedicated sortase system response regulator [Gammaproteobacteria bacterium]|nr:MAG: proteobacterial dedicated sortase system response regulator [Gammaproteobacteria bacterium]
MGRRIAIVEDEPAIRDNYAEALRRQGYEVDTYDCRQTAYSAFQQRLPDLAIIDIGLADEPEGGFDLCRDLRAMSTNVPIIFLTARDSELDTVSGFRLGADDYLTKDIGLSHLQARIAALFRRLELMKTPAVAEDLIIHGELKLDAARMMVSYNNQPVALTVTEFWLVHALVRYVGHVKTREQLMQAANIYVDEDTISSHIKRIRKKFVAVSDDFTAIETVYGLGYRWLDAQPD